MALRTATKDENVPRPRTSIMVAARDRCRLPWHPGRGRSEVLDNAPSRRVAGALQLSPARELMTNATGSFGGNAF
jgi:hypothetical protein